MKILVVEDNMDARTLCAKALRVEDHEVSAVSNGREALEFLKTQPVPALILLDLSMPDMSGEEFMSFFHANPAWKDVRVILVSGRDNLRSLCREVGAAGVLPKPFGLDELYEAIEPFL